MPIIIKPSGKAPPINDRVPDLIEMRSRITQFLCHSSFSNGVTATAQTLLEIINATPVDSRLRGQALLRYKLKRFRIPSVTQKLILDYLALRAQIILANDKLCHACVMRSDAVEALGYEMAITIARDELVKSVDTLDPVKGCLSTSMVSRTKLTLRREAVRRGYKGTRRYQEMFARAQQHWKALKRVIPSLTIDDVGRVMVWDARMINPVEGCVLYWNFIKSNSHPQHPVSLEQVA